MRQNAAFLSSRGAKLLIGLPLLLAAFALTLQVNHVTPSQLDATLDLYGYIWRSLKLEPRWSILHRYCACLMLHLRSTLDMQCADLP